MVCLESGKLKLHGNQSLKGRGEKTNSSSDAREKENLKEGVANGAQTLQHIIIITTYTVKLTHPYGWKGLLPSNTRLLSSWENGGI